MHLDRPLTRDELDGGACPRRTAGVGRAAPVRPRRVGLPAAHAARRPAGAHPAPRDRDGRRALPRAARRRRRAARARRRHGVGRDRACDRRRAPRRARDRHRRLGGRARPRPGERGAHRGSTSSSGATISSRGFPVKAGTSSSRTRRTSVPASVASLPPDVVDWEPDVALVDRGQTEALVRDARTALRPGGALVLETHEDGASGVAALLDEHGYVDVARDARPRRPRAGRRGARRGGRPG